MYKALTLIPTARIIIAIHLFPVSGHGKLAVYGDVMVVNSTSIEELQQSSGVRPGNSVRETVKVKEWDLRPK